MLIPTPPRPLLAATLPLLLALAAAPGAHAAQRELLTVPVTGAHPSSTSQLPPQQAISRDGARVVFSSTANNLDDADASRGMDVFVRDRTSAQTIRVSANSAGQEPNGASGAPALSADGNWVAFLTKATDLGVPTGDAGFADLVERDLRKAPGEPGAFRVVALDVSAGLTAQPTISADGDRVAISTLAKLSGSDDDSSFDVYVRTMSAGTTTLVSTGSGVTATDPTISADGTRVAFLTTASLAAGDDNGVADAYVRDLSAGTLMLGTPGQGPAATLGRELSLSADGTHLAFSTTAALSADDTNGRPDVYLRDLGTPATIRLSVGGANRESHGAADAPVLSDDAQRAAFASTAPDLVPERGRGFVRLRDLTRTVAPAEIDGDPTLSGDGAVIAYPRALEGTGSFVELYAEPIEPDTTDATPPTLIVPGDLMLPATYSRGRHVRFTERGSDDESGLVGTACTPGSGSNFPVGATTVRCVAADAAGNETERTFTVTIIDKVPPRLSVPDAVTLAAPAGGSVPLDTAVSAIDDVDGAAPAPTCTPAAGTLLDAGTTTTVNCQVTDSAGNAAEASYPVTVTSEPSVPAASAATVVTNERARSVAVQLTLAAPVAADTAVPVTVESGTATAGLDFSADDRTLTIPRGRRAASIVIPLVDDQRPEDTESFTVQFAGAGARPAASSTVTIKDDDGPHEDRRRRDIGPMVWVDDHGTRLLLLEGAESEPRTLVDTRTQIISDPQVSPDGTEVLYFAGPTLYRLPLAGGKPEAIDGVGDFHANHPIWRPDGEAVLYLSHEGPATWATLISLTDEREPITYSLPDQTSNTISWNPGGTQLAIIDSNEPTGSTTTWDRSDIVIIDADSGAVVRRYATPDDDAMPEWSPDGRSIVFLRRTRIAGGAVNRWSGQTVSTLDVASGAVTDLTAPADVASGSTYGPPTWSADGKAVAFVSQDRRRGTGKPYFIATVQSTGGPLSTRYDFADPDRQDLVPDRGGLEWAGLAAQGPTEQGRIVFTRGDGSGRASRLLSVAATGEDERTVADLGTVSGTPSAAADGTWLAFASNRDHPAGEIYVSTPGGRAVERITNDQEPESQPALSADGRRVAYVRGTGAGREIWLHDRETGDDRRLVAAGAAGVGEPAFEPGTDALAYVRGGDVPEIREIRLDGTGDRRLTDGTAPAFDRRAEHLAFQRVVGDADPQVYVADVTGLGAQRLTDEPGGATHPTFGPDDRSIAYATRSGIALTTVDGGQAVLATQEPTDTEPTWVRPAAPPALTVHDIAVTEGTGGTTPAGIVLTLDRPVDDPASVRLRTADGTATAPRDYTPLDERATIAPGETTVTVPVDIAADAMDEPDEQLTVAATEPAGVRIDRATATVTVRDDDDPPVLTVDDLSMPEGDLGDTDAVFQLRLSAESGWTVRAHAATHHGTTDDDDLTPTSIDVAFAPGELVQEVRVPVHGDTQNEPDERFTLAIDGQQHVTGPAGPATGTLRNDDAVGKLPDTGITGTPGTLTRTATPTFGFIGSVPRGRFECRTDALAWVPCTSPLRIRAVADGAHTFAVRAFDGDLVDPTPATFAYTVDTVAPSTTITAGPRRISPDRSPTFTMATDDPTAHLECRIDGGAWFACPPTWQAPVLADGDHEFAARAIDPAGNADPTPAVAQFRIDSRAPQTFWIQQGSTFADTTPTSSSAAVALSAGAQPKLELSAEGVVGVPVSCSAASSASCRGDVSVQELPSGGARASRARRSAATSAVLGRATYDLPPGTTETVQLRLSAAARAKVERKGLVHARVLIAQGGGTAAPLPVTLAADPLAPRLLDAGLRLRPSAAGAFAVRVRCPRAVLPAGRPSRSVRAAATARARAACRGRISVRVDGAPGVAAARLRGTPGRVVRIRLRLGAAARQRLARTASTPAVLRLTWGSRPTQTKSVDLTLTRGAAR